MWIPAPKSSHVRDYEWAALVGSPPHTHTPFPSTETSGQVRCVSWVFSSLSAGQLDLGTLDLWRGSRNQLTALQACLPCQLLPLDPTHTWSLKPRLKAIQGQWVPRGKCQWLCSLSILQLCFSDSGVFSYFLTNSSKLLKYHLFF